MPSSPSSPRALAPHSALVFSTDTLVAALLLSLLELEGLTPLFPRSNETSTVAVARLRPRVVLLDCDHPAATSDDFYAAASEAGAVVIMFSPACGRREVEAAADEHEAYWFTLPIDHARLRRLLGEVLRDATPSSD